MLPSRADFSLTVLLTNLIDHFSTKIENRRQTRICGSYFLHVHRYSTKKGEKNLKLRWLRCWIAIKTNPNVDLCPFSSQSFPGEVVKVVVALFCQSLLSIIVSINDCEFVEFMCFIFSYFQNYMSLLHRHMSRDLLLLSPHSKKLTRTIFILN